MDEKVTIIIPLYNTEDYIEKAINSVVGQTYREFELIIIDDASTDTSGIIAESKSKEDDRIIVIHNDTNMGLSASRNIGVDNASGEYILFLDSDDYIELDCLEICVRAANKYKLDILTFDAKTECLGNLNMDFIPGNYDRSHIIEPYNVMNGREFVKKYLETRSLLFPAWLLFLRRTFIVNNDISFLEGAVYEDNKYHFDCMIKADRILYIQNKLYNRVYRPNSIMTSELDLNKIYSVFDLSEGMIKTLLDSELYHDRFWLQYLEKMITICTGQVIKYFEKTERVLAEQFYEIYMSRLLGLVRKMFKILIKYQITVDDDEYLFLYKFLLNIIKKFGYDYNLCKAGSILEEIRDYQRYAIFFALFDLHILDQEEKKVGIYGTGEYAQYILETYSKFGGATEASILFIETNCISNEKKFRGRPVVSISDVQKEKLDVVIVMSTKYDKEMVESAEKYLRVPVYSMVSILGGSFDRSWKEEDTEWVEKICTLVKESRETPRIIIMNTPIHRNIGDYMIIRNMERIIGRAFPDYEIIKYTYDDVLKRKDETFSQIRKRDVVLLGGGGYLGSLWASGRVVPMIINHLRKNRIVIFPQSIFFPEDERREEWLKRYDEAISKHNDIIICTRDRFSFERAKELWGEKAKVELFPDVALLQEDKSRYFKRNGALICLRYDAESNMTEEMRECILEKTYTLFAGVRRTSMHYEKAIFDGGIDGAIDHKLDEISRAKLVITDALHCMISCALTGTPCVAIDNNYKKVSGVYEWIADLPYVKMCKDVESFKDFNIKEWDAINRKWKYDLTFEVDKERLLGLIGG